MPTWPLMSRTCIWANPQYPRRLIAIDVDDYGQSSAQYCRSYRLRVQGTGLRYATC